MFKGAGGNLHRFVFLERFPNKRQCITNSDELKVETEMKHAEIILKHSGDYYYLLVFNKNKFR